MFFIIYPQDKVCAQITYEEFKQNWKKDCIAATFLMGHWISQDSSQTQINFKQEGPNYYKLYGISDGVNWYTFDGKKDSVFVDGLAANWPPYYCKLKLVDPQTLEIKFYQLSSKDGYLRVFKRKRS